VFNKAEQGTGANRWGGQLCSVFVSATRPSGGTVLSFAYFTSSPIFPNVNQKNHSISTKKEPFTVRFTPFLSRNDTDGGNVFSLTSVVWWILFTDPSSANSVIR
jgi:hypothetical protein